MVTAGLPQAMERPKMRQASTWGRTAFWISTLAELLCAAGGECAATLARTHARATPWPPQAGSCQDATCGP